MKKKYILLLLCSLFIIMVFYSYQTNTSKPKKINYNYPSSFIIDNKDNFFDYQPWYECSAFSSSYVLRHYGYKDTGLKLFETMPNKLASGDGIYPQGIVSLFESRGFNARMIVDGTIDDLKQELSKGNPVIVYIHVEANAESVHYTHYVPVVGYDEEYLYFVESLPYKANYKDQDLPYNHKTDIETFKKLWANVEGIYESPYFIINKNEL
ncbi:MAG: C39 family peptidase [Coprobacillus sp.]